MAHHQKSFLPFSSRQSLSCCLSCVAKRSTPKLHGPLQFTLPKLHDPLSCMAAAPGFQSQHQSSSAAPFPTTPTISYTCQHSHILPALLGCHSKSGQVWPHSMESIFSKLPRRCYNQGELPPSYILGGSHSHPPGSKHAHSYLTFSMKPVKGYRYVK